jgi:hypothetical protein
MLDVKTEQQTREKGTEPQLTGEWFAFLLVNGGWWDPSLLHGRGDSAGDFTACAEAASKDTTRGSEDTAATAPSR